MYGRNYTSVGYPTEVRLTSILLYILYSEYKIYNKILVKALTQMSENNVGILCNPNDGTNGTTLGSHISVGNGGCYLKHSGLHIVNDNLTIEESTSENKWFDYRIDFRDKNNVPFSFIQPMKLPNTHQLQIYMCDGDISNTTTHKTVLKIDTTNKIFLNDYEIPYLINNYISEDGAHGFKHWSTGLKEQWGMALIPPNGSVRVNLYLHYATRLYQIQVTNQNYLIPQAPGLCERNTSYFDIDYQSATYEDIVYWYCFGY